MVIYVEQANTINIREKEFILKIWKAGKNRVVNVPRTYFLYLSGGIPKTEAKYKGYMIYGFFDEEAKCVRFTVSIEEPETILGGIPFRVAIGALSTFTLPKVASGVFEPGKYRARLFRAGNHYFVEVCVGDRLEG